MTVRRVVVDHVLFIVGDLDVSDDVFVEREGRTKWTGDGIAEGGLSRPSALGDVRADRREKHSRAAGCYSPKHREQCGWRR
jgi:hypothetical protein